MSGKLYPEIKEQVIKTNKELPKIFISHGDTDKVLDIKNMLAAHHYLEDLGYDVTFKKYQAAHTITKDNLRDMILWLSDQLQKS